MNYNKILSSVKLAKRVKIQPNGSRVFERFGPTDRLEHQLLILSFSTLAFTGLIQRYSETTTAAFLINKVMGGIDTVQVIHHIAAILFALETVFHIWRLLFNMFVNKEIGGMLPQLKDLTDLIDMVRFNSGKKKERPKFDRFSVEEKIEYWALIWGTIVMGITGFIQWFPVIVTKYMPGSIIPIARATHSWEAVLAVLAILLWHSYHTMIKERNVSIFTGLMSEKEMKHTHPLEHERIIGAYELIEDLKKTESES